MQRKSADGGTFEAPTSGELVLRFDNTFSWRRGKTVTYTAVVRAEAPVPPPYTAARSRCCSSCPLRRTRRSGIADRRSSLVWRLQAGSVLCGSRHNEAALG